jgi:D-glycero-D-manno-heptose 1,7-bisphosphate phosphatase
MLRQAVFFDRDGVLNEPLVRNGQFIGPVSMDEFRIFKNAAAQLNRLKKDGFLCIVFTNQPDISRGRLSASILDQMHAVLKEKLPLDDIVVCLHDDRHDCSCRKPKPGMLSEAAKKWKIDLKKSFVVGDRGKDIEAGQATGCKTVLIEYPYSKCRTADFTVSNLAEAVDVILRASHDK